MNITYIVGNGFDINIGLKTTYKAFLNEYKKDDEKDTDIIKWFKKVVLSDEELWSSAEVAFGKTTEKFGKEKYNADDFYLCYEDFCIKLAKYLKEQESRIDDSKLDVIAKTTFFRAFTNYLNGFREAEKQEINSLINNIGSGFKYNFVSFNYTTTLDKCIKSIKNNKVSMGKRNYANTSYENSLGNVFHIHGYTDKDMVFGVNDETQISDMGIFEGFGDEYVDQLIKVKTNNMNGEKIDVKVHNLIKESDLIYIFGMSIGETDKLWWSRICEAMKIRDKMQLIIYNYEVPQMMLFQRSFRTFVNSERNKFMSFSNLNDVDKNSIANRIHFARTNIFDGLNVCLKDNDDIN